MVGFGILPFRLNFPSVALVNFATFTLLFGLSVVVGWFALLAVVVVDKQLADSCYSWQRQVRSSGEGIAGAVIATWAVLYNEFLRYGRVREGVRRQRSVTWSGAAWQGGWRGEVGRRGSGWFP